MADYIQVLTTIDSKEGAQGIARALVEKRLAACVQVVGPITSTYWWDNEIATDEEWMCVIKSGRGHYDALEAAIHALHPYDEPEIIATPIVAGSQGYLGWLATELAPAGGE